MAAPAATQNSHLLRLILSCRIFTAQVTAASSNTIIAMASSTEQEFAAAQYRAKLNTFPRSHIFWTSKTASLIGDKIALRIAEIGLSTVRIDVQEEISRPLHYHENRNWGMKLASFYLHVELFCLIEIKGVELNLIYRGIAQKLVLESVSPFELPNVLESREADFSH